MTVTGTFLPVAKVANQHISELQGLKVYATEIHRAAAFIACVIRSVSTLTVVTRISRSITFSL